MITADVKYCKNCGAEIQQIGNVWLRCRPWNYPILCYPDKVATPE